MLPAGRPASSTRAAVAALTRNDAPATIRAPAARRRKHFRARSRRQPAGVTSTPRPLRASSAGRCPAVVVLHPLLHFQIRAAAVRSTATDAAGRLDAVMRTPHSSRPRSRLEQRPHARSTAGQLPPRALVLGKQREQLQRDHRSALEEKFDHRRHAPGRGATPPRCPEAPAGTARRKSVPAERPRRSAQMPRSTGSTRGGPPAGMPSGAPLTEGVRAD